MNCSELFSPIALTLAYAVLIACFGRISSFLLSICFMPGLIGGSFPSKRNLLLRFVLLHIDSSSLDCQLLLFFFSSSLLCSHEPLFRSVMCVCVYVCVFLVGFLYLRACALFLSFFFLFTTTIVISNIPFYCCFCLFVCFKLPFVLLFLGGCAYFSSILFFWFSWQN